MATLNRITSQAADEEAARPINRTVDISLNIGRTLALLLIGLLVLAGALALYLADEDTPAAAFFALGEAIVVSGFGVAYGEQSGAADAVRKLTE